VAYLLKQLVVPLSVRLEVQAKIEQGLLQSLFIAQKQWDEQSPHASIAIQKWVYGLKLHMQQGRFNQRGSSYRLVVKVLLPVIQAGHQLVNRRRDEQCISRARAANPVLAMTELPWEPILSSALGKEPFVNLSDEPQRERTTGLNL
jgi:hypothetical protein